MKSSELLKLVATNDGIAQHCCGINSIISLCTNYPFLLHCKKYSTCMVLVDPRCHCWLHLEVEDGCLVVYSKQLQHHLLTMDLQQIVRFEKPYGGGGPAAQLQLVVVTEVSDKLTLTCL